MAVSSLAHKPPSGVGVPQPEAYSLWRGANKLGDPQAKYNGVRIDNPIEPPPGPANEGREAEVYRDLGDASPLDAEGVVEFGSGANGQAMRFVNSGTAGQLASAYILETAVDTVNPLDEYTIAVQLQMSGAVSNPIERLCSTGSTTITIGRAFVLTLNVADGAFAGQWELGAFGTDKLHWFQNVNTCVITYRTGVGVTAYWNSANLGTLAAPSIDATRSGNAFMSNFFGSIQEGFNGSIYTWQEIDRCWTQGEVYQFHADPYLLWRYGSSSSMRPAIPLDTPLHGSSVAGHSIEARTSTRGHSLSGAVSAQESALSGRGSVRGGNIGGRGSVAGRSIQPRGSRR